jgi:hypothetical protein
VGNKKDRLSVLVFQEPFCYLRGYKLRQLKKITILALLALLLLNVAGYYGILIMAKLQNQQALHSLFDADQLDEHEVDVIKIPLTLAYPVQDNGYQRVDGIFEYKGEFLRLIKQRIYKDTLFIVVAKDHQEKKIREALTDYVKTFTDMPTDSNGGTRIKFDFIKYYISPNQPSSHPTDVWNYLIPFQDEVAFTQVVYLSIPSPPPKA